MPAAHRRQRTLFGLLSVVNETPVQPCVYVCVPSLGVARHNCLPLLPSHDSVPAAAESFDFETYMKSRAKMVNAALDKAVPLEYPEDLTESMRCA